MTIHGIKACPRPVGMSHQAHSMLLHELGGSNEESMGRLRRPVAPVRHLLPDLSNISRAIIIT
jgi:hypothetical protein